MTRQALFSDLDSIMEIVSASIQIMQSHGNFQWDDKYPLRPDFEADIKEGALYLCDQDGKAAGFMCVNCDEPAVYSLARWQSSGPAMVLHRMAVSPDFRGRGVGGGLIAFAWETARKNGASSLRTDTYSKNLPMNSLFIKHGFQKTGDIELPGKILQPFTCYEKTS